MPGLLSAHGTCRLVYYRIYGRPYTAEHHRCNCDRRAASTSTSSCCSCREKYCTRELNVLFFEGVRLSCSAGVTALSGGRFVFLLSGALITLPSMRVPSTRSLVVNP